MAYGLRTFDADGNVLVDFSTQLTRMMFTKYVGAYESGSIDVPGFSDNGGHAWASVVKPFSELVGYTPPLQGQHVVTVVGDTISWQPNPFRAPSYIYALMWGPG